MNHELPGTYQPFSIETMLRHSRIQHLQHSSRMCPPPMLGSYCSCTILFLQNKSIHILCAGACYHNDHSNPSVAKMNTLKINYMYFLQNALFMFRLNFSQLPTSFSYMFQFNKDVHFYPIRHSNKYHIFNPKTVMTHKSIRHSSPNI